MGVPSASFRGNLVGLHAWEVDESKLHKRDLTFHYVSAAAMYEMDDAHGKHLHKAVLFETGVLDSSLLHQRQGGLCRGREHASQQSAEMTVCSRSKPLGAEQILANSAH